MSESDLNALGNWWIPLPGGSPSCALPAAGHQKAAPAFDDDLQAVRSQLQQAKTGHG